MFSHCGEGRCGVDRCALFVDAGYVLADGAMAVHGTRRRESVSWDYAGLLQLFGSLAMERTRLPLLRCYWYEATVEGRRTADHETLADLPGVKLRVAKTRPGRREGVESEIRRDLTTLARNKAVSDVVVVSAEEDLAQVIADVQDMGLRVTLLHIDLEGSWAASRALRQECDDFVEISAAHLRPYVELISGAEPPRPDESESARRASPGHKRQRSPREQRERQDARDGTRRRVRAAGQAGARAAASGRRRARTGSRAAGPGPARPAQARGRTPPWRADFGAVPDLNASVDYSASVDYGAPADYPPVADHRAAADQGPAVEYGTAIEYGTLDYAPAPAPDYLAHGQAPMPTPMPAAHQDIYAAPVVVPGRRATSAAGSAQIRRLPTR